MGADYWALVIQTVSYEAIYLLLILYISGLPDLSWSTAAARRLWSISSRVMGADLVNYVSDQSDKFFIARFLGPTPLALYSLAFRVLQLTLAVLAQASVDLSCRHSRASRTIESGWLAPFSTLPRAFHSSCVRQ